jgi:division protein CdvB (Snf7/Vps24/ESCRT-III family)
MNRQMNLPALQRIAMEFEKENDIMDQRQEMMDDAIDDVTGLEDEEEGEEVVNQVLDEIGIDLGQSVRDTRPPRSNVVTDVHLSSVRLLQACKSLQSQKAEWRKQLVGHLMLAMMTFKPV